MNTGFYCLFYRPSRLLSGSLAMACLLTASVWAHAADTVRRGLGPEPDSLNIHQAQGLTAINLLRDLREGLVTFNAAGELVPGVASAWEISDRGTRYRFTLRPDARWSNGDPVTADEFVRAWQLALTPESPAVTAGLLANVKNASAVLNADLPVSELGITALGDKQLEILLEKPAPWLLEILAHPVSYPLHHSLGATVQEDPVNGAFRLGEWTPRSAIRLERNPEYHSVDSVALETVEYFPIEEPSTELARYRAGELDITETIPAGRFEWLQENLAPDLRINAYLGSYWLGLNLQHDELGRSAELRQALALAIDRGTLVRVVLGAGELQGWGVVPPGIPGYEVQQMGLASASQAEREIAARQLYARAGFGLNRPLRLELRYNTSGLHRRIAVTVAAMWKQVLGVNTELINEEWKVFVNNRRMGTVTEVFRGGWIADYADPASFLDLFITGSELNTTFYSDSTFDQLMEQAGNQRGEARMAILQQAEARLLETMPVIPLYYYVSRHLVRPEIRGYEDNSRDIHLSRYLFREAGQ
ncbi:MAG TPA: peptide ABC transporter substrate-binding protein [Xanthomonadales bacterium]|nr:peptide ABC transporter substrate-binding protein [Xanthomonadales bacterium]